MSSMNVFSLSSLAFLTSKKFKSWSLSVFSHWALASSKCWKTLTLMVQHIPKEFLLYPVSWLISKKDGSCVCSVKLIYITLCKCATWAYKLSACWAVDEVQPGVWEVHLHQTQSSQKRNIIYMTEAWWVGQQCFYLVALWILTENRHWFKCVGLFIKIYFILLTHWGRCFFYKKLGEISIVVISGCWCTMRKV